MMANQCGILVGKVIGVKGITGFVGLGVGGAGVSVGSGVSGVAVGGASVVLDGSGIAVFVGGFSVVGTTVVGFTGVVG